MRHTMKDVEYYVDRINNKIAENGGVYRYHATSRNGYKALDLGVVGESRLIATIESGLTTGQLYNVVYGIFLALSYLQAEDIMK